MTPELFNTESQLQLPNIRGLGYHNNFVDPDYETFLISAIDSASAWSSAMRRRVQHYGYKYDYRTRTIDMTMVAAPFPDWLIDLRQMLYHRRLLTEFADQAIINEYLPGQGIYRHIDCEPCFGPEIVSLSIGSDCVMEFTHRLSQQTQCMVLSRRSVLRLTDEARFEWMHGIPARRTDRYDGRRIVRQRRISITFRKVILMTRQLES
jgi:alkylated DNA repair dioxygenase AlkB